MSESARSGAARKGDPGPQKKRTRNPAAATAIGIVAAIAAIVIVAAMLLPGPDLSLRFAIAFASIETVIAFVLLPGLICAKHIRARNEQKSGRRREQILKWLPDSAEAAMEAGRLETAALEWPEEFLDILQQALSALSGSQKLRIAAIAQTSGLLPRLVRDAVGTNVNPAARAIRILSAIDDEPARDAIRKAMEHDSVLVRVTAKRAVLAGAGIAPRLDALTSLAGAPLWERVVLFHAAADDPALLATFAAETFNSDSDDQLLLALEMIYSRTSLTLCTAPASLAVSPNLEIRIRFFKALPFMNFEGNVTETLRQGLNDTDWRVRAMAAKACSRLVEPALTEDLFRLCSVFENPAEASHAARALAALGGSGRLRLERLARSESAVKRGIAAETVEAQWMREGAA